LTKDVNIFVELLTPLPKPAKAPLAHSHDDLVALILAQQAQIEA